MSSSEETLVSALGHNELGVADIAVQTISLVIASLVVYLRLWSRHLRLDPLTYGDWFILVALALISGRYALEIALVLHCGAGLHTAEVIRIGGPADMNHFIQLAYTSDLLRVTVAGLIQVAVLQHYLHAYPRTFIRWPIFILLGLGLSLWMTSLVATAVICVPANLVQLSSSHEELYMLHVGASVTELILNGLILLASMPILKITLFTAAREIATACIYMLASSILIISGIRIRMEIQGNPGDFTFEYARTSLLSTAILVLGIITSSLPFMSPAAGRIFQTSLFSPTVEGVTMSPVLLDDRENTILLGVPAVGRPTPMVTVTMPPIVKCVSERAREHITITSDWEIHSTRNSTRIERFSMRRGGL
ncbi:Uncharacterized protein PECH_004584 [Penicillium ucsense]|uniref:Rhodopsin domain-containing protein n=1 Tax=Penicillium ucsense TaxID=2839758 RepID=A0A8J8W256_9EURO|nr:Uncharacterized protein PECM_006194 [Penicillium ucsense]KAF7736928.1 Uncharacterized protein PECH_004584 [Penicillium ucsense]